MMAKLTFLAKGYRDIYWCYHLNEPVIIEYRDDEPFCRNCNGNPLDAADTAHVFICHVLKP